MRLNQTVCVFLYFEFSICNLRTRIANIFNVVVVSVLFDDFSELSSNKLKVTANFRVKIDGREKDISFIRSENMYSGKKS